MNKRVSKVLYNDCSDALALLEEEMQKAINAIATEKSNIVYEDLSSKIALTSEQINTTVSKLQEGVINNENLEISDTNLAFNTGWCNDTTYWWLNKDSDSTGEIFVDTGLSGRYKGISAKCTQYGQWFILTNSSLARQKFKFKPGKKYTFKGKIWCNLNKRVYINIANQDSSNKIMELYVDCIANQYIDFKITFVAPAEGGDNHIRFYMDQQDMSLFVPYFKLAEGDKTGPWSASPLEGINGNFETHKAFTEFKQEADEFQLSATRELENKADKLKLISLINLSPEKIKIASRLLELDGLVTIVGLEDGSTIIDGGCLRTGTISSINIEGCNFRAGNFRGIEMFYIEGGGTFSADGKTYLRDVYIPYTHEGWEPGTYGSFKCGAPAFFGMDVTTGKKVYIHDGDTFIERVDGTPNLMIGSHKGSTIIKSKYSGGNIYADTDGYFSPGNDQAWALGNPSYRWSTAYVGSVNQALFAEENITRTTFSSDKTAYNFIRDEFKLLEDNSSLRTTSDSRLGFSINSIKDERIKNLILREEKEIVRTEDGSYRETGEKVFGYDVNNFVNLLADALQKSISEIESLKERIIMLENK